MAEGREKDREEGREDDRRAEMETVTVVTRKHNYLDPPDNTPPPLLCPRAVILSAEYISRLLKAETLSGITANPASQPTRHSVKYVIKWIH